MLELMMLSKSVKELSVIIFIFCSCVGDTSKIIKCNLVALLLIKDSRYMLPEAIE